MSGLENWRRHALLVISVVLVSAGLILGATNPEDMVFLRANCLRIGIVLFMLWLALPQLKQLNYWAITPVAIISLIAIVRPQLLLVIARMLVPLAPILFFIWVFWKAKRKRPSS